MCNSVQDECRAAELARAKERKENQQHPTPGRDKRLRLALIGLAESVRDCRREFPGELVLDKIELSIKRRLGDLERAARPAECIHCRGPVTHGHPCVVAWLCEEQRPSSTNISPSGGTTTRGQRRYQSPRRFPHQ